MSAVVKLSDRALAANVDRLGELNAEIAALAGKAKEIKEKLIASGCDEISGKSFKAVIISKDAVGLDLKKVRKLLSEDDIFACRKVVESVSVSLYDL